MLRFQNFLGFFSFACLTAAHVSAEGLPCYAMPDGYKINREGTRIFSTEAFDLAALKKKNAIWDSERRTVALVGAKNEVVAFQIILEGGAAGRKEMDLRFTEFTGPGKLHARPFELFKAWYVEVKSPSAPQNAPSAGVGWYPDALVPWDVQDTPDYDGPPFSIEQDRVQAVWVDLSIPEEAAAGAYRVQLEVLAGGKPCATLEVRLQVLNFALPQETHNLLLMNGNPPDIWAAGGYWLGKNEEAKTQYEEACFRLARRHRFVCGNMYFETLNKPASLYPQLTLNAAGSIEAVDWTAYDARWSKVLDAKKNIFGRDAAPIEYWRLPIVSGIKGDKKKFPATEKAWAEFPTWIRKHWEEKGWDLERAYVYLADEPRPEHFAAIEKYARILKEATQPPLHTQVAVLPHPAKNHQAYSEEFIKRFAGLLDRWLWSANSADPGALHAQLRQSDWKGYYQGNEPYVGTALLDKDGLDLRSWPWIAWHYKLDFSCYYSITEFQGESEDNRLPSKPNEIWFNHLNRPNGNQGKGMLLYPGGLLKCDRPIASMRLKQVRRGQQDFEYMRLLAGKSGREKVDAAVRKIIVKALNESAGANEPGTKGAWNRDPEFWDAAVKGWGQALEEAGP